jgi:hypothetical protein
MSTPVGVHAPKEIFECKRKQNLCEDGQQIFEDGMGPKRQTITREEREKTAQERKQVQC